ncbi:transmembrane protein 121B [Latimeria chalumnae]
MTLSAPLLYTLVNSILESTSGQLYHQTQGYFINTCLDLLDSFTLVELMLQDRIPLAYLKYTVISVYFLVLIVPVLWLYDLNASPQLSCRWIFLRFLSSLVVNGPLLVLRVFLVIFYQHPISIFMLKNIFFLACRSLELLEQCCALKGRKKYSTTPVQFSHCISENDMCPHGYVNTLAVTTQN